MRLFVDFKTYKYSYSIIGEFPLENAAETCKRKLHKPKIVLKVKSINFRHSFILKARGL